MDLCDYGCGNEVKYILKNGKKCCSEYYQACPINISKNKEKKIGYKYPLGKGMKGKIPWNKGKTLEESVGLERSIEINNKKSIALTGKPSHSTGYAATPEREKERRQKLKLKSGGYRKGSGRGKSGWYKGYWCDSSYELAYVIYNIDHGIPFIRNTKKFSYLYENQIHYWIPDFIVYNKYVEVKGYLSEKDKCKLDQFEEDITLLINKSIQPYIDYTKEKYGKNFIELYDNSKYKKIVKDKAEPNIKFCYICGNQINKKSKYFCSVECYNKSQRRITRPSKKELEELIKVTPFTTIGKQFKVSDNAIRKWCKTYEIQIGK